MVKTKATVKVSIYMASCAGGQRTETLWEDLDETAQQAWRERAMDRMMAVLGYERAAAEDCEDALGEI